MENYIHWIFNSNQDAQKIISNALKEEPGKSIKGSEIYIHLAADALRKRKYLTAEDYLRLAVDHYSSWNLKNNYSYFKYCTIRMYLLFMNGDIEGAKQVGQEYVNVIEKRIGHRGKVEISARIDEYLNWLAHIFK